MRARVACLTVLLMGSMGSGAALAGPPAEEGTRWFQGTYDQALAAAKTEKKLVLFDAWAKWCTYCKLMDREVWNRPEVARQLEAEVIPFKAEVDNKTGVGMDLGRRLGIGPLPCTLVINPDTGRILERMEGTQDAKKILDAIDRARLSQDPKQALAEAADDPAELVRIAGQLWRADKKEPAQEALRRAIKADPDCTKDMADEAALLLADIIQINDPAGAYAVLHQAGLACSTPSRAAELWQRMTVLAQTTQGDKAMGDLLRLRAQRFPQDPEALLESARWCFEHGEDLALAARQANQVLHLSPEETRAMALLAELEAREGRFTEALDWLGKAIQVDPQNVDLRELRLNITRASQKQK